MKKGQILVTVLLVTAIISLIFSGFIILWEGNISKTQAQIAEKQALYLAEGMAEIAIYSLIWFTNIPTYTSFGPTTFSYTDFYGVAKSDLTYSATESYFVINALSNITVVYTGQTYTYSRGLKIEGLRSRTSAPYSITILSWTEW
ncbi:MAG: hypothetical protein N2Z64_07180 [Dictyoglomus thermophilum]|nr:hypothetical protein [Dictyoglomus thermophilum]MCX7721045.1 hypothetical protein [Dictyoglomus thermophilum]